MPPPAPPAPPPSRQQTLSQHALKQLKFVLPGLAVTYFFDTHRQLWDLVHSEDAWARLFALTSLACGLITIALFLYILLTPLARGVQRDYALSRQSGEFSTVVPLLTASTVIGCPLLSYTLSQWASLGILKGIIAASGLYALTFGLVGLLNSPMI